MTASAVELADLDADVEQDHADHDAALGQPEVLQAGREPEPVDEAEAEHDRAHEPEVLRAAA